MKIKILSCLYCEQEMEVVSLKKRFCSDKCRVYFNRESKHYNGGFVYCLRNPLDDNKVFYIGKTIGSLTKRLNAHKNDKHKDTEKAKIIKLILDGKKDVIIEEIEFVDDILALDEREKYWIKNFSEDKLSNINNYKRCKSNPIGVRFDIEIFNMIQKTHNLTSAQQVLNFLMDNYFSIKEVKRGAPFKNMPPYDRNSPKPEVSSKLEQIPVENQKTPPKGLKGIDLMIWKSENGI